MNERFVESRYAGHTYDTVTEMDYYLTDEHILCKGLARELEREHSFNRLRSDMVMKRDNLINALLRENYLLQCEAYDGFEDYLEKSFEPLLQAYEIIDWSNDK